MLQNQTPFNYSLGKTFRESAAVVVVLLLSLIIGDFITSSNLESNSSVAAENRRAGDFGSNRLLTWHELRNLPVDCPVIYDNDWLSDTPCDEYLFAKVNTGEANLKGLIVTRDVNHPEDPEEKHQQQFKNFLTSIERCRRSGMVGIPDPVLGARYSLTKPASGIIEDTKFTPTPGSALIVTEAKSASVSKPLLVNVGGQSTTMATAYLSDPSIALKVIVMITYPTAYNGVDSWAAYILTTRCRAVVFGRRDMWWPQNPNGLMSPGRFSALPRNEITDRLLKLATSWVAPGHFHDGYGDGGPLLLIYARSTWNEPVKAKVNGLVPGKKRDVLSYSAVTEGEPYDFLDAQSLDWKAMDDDFFRTLADPTVWDGKPAPGNNY